MQFRKAIIALMFPAVMLAGCQSQNTEEHLTEAFLLTDYSDSYELFAEAEPMVCSKTGNITAHITKLPEYKPFSDKYLKATLSIAGQTLEQVAEESSPGIYRFCFSPSKAGEGTLTFALSSEQQSGQVFSFPVKVFADEDSAEKAAHAAQVKNSNAITFTKEQSWKTDFSTEVCKLGPMSEVVRTMAQVLPSLADERVISSPVAGVVTFASDAVVEGKKVAAGELLFTVDNSALKDDGNISLMAAQAESEYNLAKSEYERKAALAEDRIVSESDLLAARRNYETAKARYDNLKRNYSSGKQRVTSPQSGYVSSMAVRSGEFVQTGQSVMTISKGGSLYLKAELQPKYYRCLENFVSANIKLPSGEVVELADKGGKLLSYGKSAGASSPLIPVTFQVGSISGLISGTFVEMYIKSEGGKLGITVPAESVVEEMGNYFVFVQLTPELFEKREVVIGSTDASRREIVSGLSEGERVVGKGAILVKLSQATGKLDAHSGHVH